MIQTCLFNLLPILLAVLFFLVFMKRKNSFNNLKLPPSPPRFPFIGNLHQLGSLPHISLCNLANKYGPIMLLQLGQVPTIVISSHELAKQVMKNHDRIFANRPFSKLAKLIFRGGSDIAFAPYGEYWRQARKLCITRLLNAKMVQSFRNMKQEEVDSMINTISQLSSANGVVNLSQVLKLFSSNVISRAVSAKFSNEEMKRLLSELSEENSKIFGAFNIEEYLPIIGHLRTSGLVSRAIIVGNRWNDVMDEVIKEQTECRSNKDKAMPEVISDFVDVLLSLENDSNREYSFTRAEIKAILNDMFAAGSDTSSTVLEYTMSELIQNPEVMIKLKDEVRGVAKGKETVSEENLSKMSYLKAVIKEAMRMHAPVPFLLPRESMESCKLAGYDIPKKTRVLINVWAIGRDHNVWEEPEKFKPERFIGSAIDFKGLDFQFTPFGAGRRICPGMHFAMQTIELALANLINKFDWAMSSGVSENGLNMNDKFGLVTSLAESLNLVAERVAFTCSKQYRVNSIQEHQPYMLVYVQLFLPKCSVIKLQLTEICLRLYILLVHPCQGDNIHIQTVIAEICV